MQASHINCITTAMAKFCNAARNMEQVVMFPSLLREVGVEEDLHPPDSETKDMYELYVKLKNIRMILEHGLVPAENQKTDSEDKTADSMDDEQKFYHHLTGMFCILGRMTKESNALTTKYGDLIGMPK